MKPWPTSSWADSDMASAHAKGFPAGLDWRIAAYLSSQGWSGFRPFQLEVWNALSRPGALEDCLLCAPTAAGKTEAALLPLLQRSVNSASDATETAAFAQGWVLWVTPLRALVNDLAQRLRPLCDTLEWPVVSWHGEASRLPRERFFESPRGLVLMTPESLEALLALRPEDARRAASRLSAVVIDEFHSLLGQPRGAQLQSLLSRLERLAGIRTPRLALSATVGDPQTCAKEVRPSSTARVLEFRQSTDIAIGLSVFEQLDPERSWEQEEVQALGSRIEKLIRHGRHLVFPNTRGRCEALANALHDAVSRSGSHLEVHVHHASISRPLRHQAEQSLREASGPVAAVCTHTLELGIDLGQLDGILQVGAPSSVSSLRQRLGRSGRREGRKAQLRLFAPVPLPGADFLQALRTPLMQALASAQLLLEGWCETPRQDAFQGSVLVQQLLSLVAQHHGASAAQLYGDLRAGGMLSHWPTDSGSTQLSPALFGELLQHLGSVKLLVQGSGGELLWGPKAEELCSRHDFYASFAAAREREVRFDGALIGHWPSGVSVKEGEKLMLGARAWEVRSVSRQLIEVQPTSQAGTPVFPSEAPEVDERIHRRMLELYDESPPEAWALASATARQHWQQASIAYQQLALSIGRTRRLEGFWVTPVAGSSRCLRALVDAAKDFGLKSFSSGPFWLVEIRNPKESWAAICQELSRSLQCEEFSPQSLDEGQRIEQPWEWALPSRWQAALRRQSEWDVAAAVRVLDDVVRFSPEASATGSTTLA